MPERLLEVLVPKEREEGVARILAGAEPIWSWRQEAGGAVQFKALVDATAVEGALDALQPLVAGEPSSRVLVLPVEASVPDRAAQSAPDARPKLPGRLSREEIYADLREHADVTPTYLGTVALSTVVAAVGLSRDQPAVVIGAMVIAPLLGPNMALSLATTLGDIPLLLKAARTAATGFAVALAIAFAAGILWPVDPSIPEIASRTGLRMSDLVVALAAGTAGALAVATGVAGSLVGVMVAVALLPPTVVSALLLAAGEPEGAARAALLVAVNVICLNLAAVATFCAKGIHPRTFWEARRSARATRIALALWTVLLLLAALLVIWLGLRD